MKTSRILIVDQQGQGGDMSVEARQVTVGTILSVLAIFTSGIGVYTGMKTETAKIAVHLDNMNNKIAKLDDYDLHLQKQLDKGVGRIIKLEAKVNNQQENYDKLADGLSSLGKEIRTLSDTLIRMEK